MAKRSASALLVPVVGLLWAMESVLGKAALSRGYSAFDFPIVLNAGTVLACLGVLLSKRNRASVLTATRQGLAAQASVALTLVFVPYLVIYLSLRALTPAETSLITSMTPMFSLLLGAAWFRTGIRLRHLGGVLAGLAGVAVLEFPSLRDPSRGGQAAWYLVMLAVPASYALSGYAVRRAGRLDVSYLQMLLVTNAVSLALFLAVNGGFALPAGSTPGSAAVLLAGILCNILSVVLLLRLSRLVSPLSLSLANYATVLFAFILGAVYLGEPVGATAAVAAVLVTASSLLLARDREGERGDGQAVVLGGPGHHRVGREGEAPHQLDLPLVVPPADRPVPGVGEHPLEGVDVLALVELPPDPPPVGFVDR